MRRAWDLLWIAVWGVLLSGAVVVSCIGVTP